MSTSQILNIVQIVISAVLISGVLMQARGGGASGLFGGGGGGDVYHTKRGLEKIIFAITTIAAIAFLILGVVQLIIAK